MAEDEVQNDEDMEKVNDLLKELEESTYPKQKIKDNVLLFFRDILNLDDSSKIGNLEDYELGSLPLNVRFYQDLALYAKCEGLSKVSEYLAARGEIILATSLSKKGFLAELLVTQIKKDKKSSPSKAIKEGWFSKKQEEPSEEGQNESA